MRNCRQSIRRGQRGFSLIEGLVAILIFSIGVMALIVIQATSIQQSSDAKYRSDATLLVNRLIGEMWVGNRTPTALQAAYQPGGVAYEAWKGSVESILPGAAAAAPEVTVTAAGQVTVTVSWKAPGEDPAAPRHSYTAVAQIR